MLLDRSSTATVIFYTTITDQARFSARMKLDKSILDSLCFKLQCFVVISDANETVEQLCKSYVS